MNVSLFGIVGHLNSQGSNVLRSVIVDGTLEAASTEVSFVFGLVMKALSVALGNVVVSGKFVGAAKANNGVFFGRVKECGRLDVVQPVESSVVLKASGVAIASCPVGSDDNNQINVSLFSCL